jgi:hypothetical protein
LSELRNFEKKPGSFSFNQNPNNNELTQDDVKGIFYNFKIELFTIDPGKIKVKKTELNQEIRKKLQDFLTEDVSSITSQFKKLKAGDKEDFLKVWNNFKLISLY